MKATWMNPYAEDFNWYAFFAAWDSQTYLIGASAGQEDANNGVWSLQVEKQRSIKERLLGKDKMTEDDGCLLIILSILNAESQFKNIELE